MHIVSSIRAIDLSVWVFQETLNDYTRRKHTMEIQRTNKWAVRVCFLGELIEFVVDGKMKLSICLSQSLCRGTLEHLTYHSFSFSSVILHDLIAHAKFESRKVEEPLLSFKKNLYLIDIWDGPHCLQQFILFSTKHNGEFKFHAWPPLIAHFIW